MSRNQQPWISGAVLCLWLVALLAAGCAKKAVVAPPVAPVMVPKAEAPPPPPALPPAPRIEASKIPVAEPPVPLEEVVPAPPPSPGRKTKKRPVRASRRPASPAPARSAAPPQPVQTAQSRAAPGGSEASPEPQGLPPAAPMPESGLPSPQLARILTAEESRSYARRLDQALDRSRSALVLIQGKTLTPSQKETVSRIQAFLRQAEQSRDQDLPGAANLAERADLLSRDLLARLR